MRCGSNIGSETASRLDRARRLLRGQLETLANLAAIALRRIEGVAAPRSRVDPARPLVAVGALERAVRDHLRIAWALRLIWALRAKLVGDLERVERGEGVDEVLAAQARAPLAEAPDDPDDDSEADPETESAAEHREASARETERPERESFGHYLSNRSRDGEFADILQRPTEEVLALIREALGLDPAQAQDTVFAQSRSIPRNGPETRLRRGWPPPVDRGPGLRVPLPSGPDLRSPT